MHEIFPSDSEYSAPSCFDYETLSVAVAGTGAGVRVMPMQRLTCLSYANSINCCKITGNLEAIMARKGYPFWEIEPKWQKYWLKNKTFKAVDNDERPKFYALDMFPYPSGAGLHVGHPEGYTATDVIIRYKKMQGFNVLHPMGWDSFGLPAEQYAIQTGVHPAITTKKNIATFKKQIRMLGLAYDWDREIATSNPDYYKWTQWVFIQMFKAGLAYQKEVAVNWCPEMGTVLADEEVENGVSVRGGFPVFRKPMRQWMLRITAYADRLLKDLDLLDWPKGIIEQQRNWIGRSEGAQVDFELPDSGAKLTVYTTRPDTLFGATYMVIAPEHPMIKTLTTSGQKSQVDAYVKAAVNRSERQRINAGKEKTGVFTGSYAINPINGQKIPIWVADYVLMSYGTGAIMAVPAHDERDFDFARHFGLPIVEVVSPDGKAHAPLNNAFIGRGVAINSGQFNGLQTEEFKEKITQSLEEKGIGKRTVNYKLRDWVFSRQRYWGEPIPLIYVLDNDDNVEEIKPIPENQLPLTLPEVESYKPAGTGESPLALIEDWVWTTDPETGRRARRETHTMPQWAGSCWYYLRYLDPQNKEQIVDPAKEKYWAPVDLYVGGAEHAVLHLLYARFWHKFLYDIGVVSTPEPFMKLVNQGLILGEDGRKMSKSLGNVINPDDMVSEYGADSLRVFEMFLGPLEVVKPWNTSGLGGAQRFLDRIYHYVTGDLKDEPPASLLRTMHKTIKKMTEDIERIRYNTGIAQVMILLNEAEKAGHAYKSVARTMVLLISPFAPHLAEELWEKLGNKPSISDQAWPEFDPALVVDEEVTVVIQVNGKLRSKMVVQKDLPNAEMEEMALKNERIHTLIEGKPIRRVIVIPNKLVNIVV